MSDWWASDPVAGNADWWTSDPVAPSGPSVAEDVAKSTAIAVPQTAIGLAGLPGTVSDLIGRGVNAAGNYLFPPKQTLSGLITGEAPQGRSYEDYKKRRAELLGGADIAAPTTQAIQGTVEQATGPFYQPKTVPGQFANTTTQFALSGGRAGLIPRVAAGVGSEAAGQFAEGTPAEIPVRIGGALVAGAGAGKIGNVLSARRAEKAIAGVTPTLEEFKGKEGIVSEGYKGARELGVELNPTAVHQGIKDIRSDLATNPEFSVDPKLMKNLNTILKQAEAEFAPAQAGAMSALTGVQPTAKASVEFGKLDALRRNIGAIANNKSPENATQATAARSAQRQLDSMVENINPADVVKGDAALLAKTIADARGNRAAQGRIQAIEDLRQRAADAAKNVTGVSNYERALRTQVRAFVRPSKGSSPAMREGLNPEEITALRRSIGGTLGTRLLHYGGGLLGGGSGLGGLAAYEVGNETGGHGLGGAALGLTGLLAGRALRGASNSIARKQAERLGALIASRSPAAAAARATLPPFRPPTSLLGSLALPLGIAGTEPRQR